MSAARNAAQRLREPSTWAGLSALALLFGQSDAAQALQVLGHGVPDVIGGLAALVAVVKADTRP